MNIKYMCILLASSSLLLSSCATTSNSVGKGSQKQSNSLDVTGLSEFHKILAYENQLVKGTQAPYATLTVLQSTQDYRRGLTANPYGIYAVDGVPVKKLPYSLFGNGWLNHAIPMSIADVKIPAGKHKVEIGQITAWNTSDHTLPEMNFLPDNKYILVSEGGRKNRTLSVYTYEQDSRFSRLSRDSIILKDKVLTHKIK